MDGRTDDDDDDDDDVLENTPKLRSLFFKNKHKDFGSFLVDPASSICLSLRLSHACLSINHSIPVKLRTAH